MAANPKRHRNDKLIKATTCLIVTGCDFFKNQVDLDVQVKRLVLKITALGFEVKITKSQIA